VRLAVDVRLSLVALLSFHVRLPSYHAVLDRCTRLDALSCLAARPISIRMALSGTRRRAVAAGQPGTLPYAKHHGHHLDHSQKDVAIIREWVHQLRIPLPGKGKPLYVCMSTRHVAPPCPGFSGPAFNVLLESLEVLVNAAV
jgi:hypothetical protein